METAQTARAITPHTERIDVEHRARMRRNHEIAMKPVALRLLGAEKEQIFRESRRHSPRQLVIEEEIIKLVRRHDDLELVLARFVARDLIHEQVRFQARGCKTGSNQLADFDDEKVRFRCHEKIDRRDLLPDD